MNKSNKEKQAHGYREQSSDYQRGRARREGKMGKGGQLYGDGWKSNFGGEHTVVYTEVEI